MAAQGWSTAIVPSISLVSISLGPLLTGVMIEHLVLGIVCSQTATYFRHHFSNDGLFIRSIVTSLAVLNILIGIMNLLSIYRSTVLAFGDFDKYDRLDWASWAGPGVTALVALVAHTFYICRCWTVTRSLPILIFLIIVPFLAFASGITVSIFCFVLGRLSKIAKAITPCYLCFLSVSK